MKNILCVMALILAFSGCSAKEFNKGVDDIGKDLSKLFEVRE